MYQKLNSLDYKGIKKYTKLIGQFGFLVDIEICWTGSKSEYNLSVSGIPFMAEAK